MQTHIEYMDAHDFAGTFEYPPRKPFPKELWLMILENRFDLMFDGKSRSFVEARYNLSRSLQYPEPASNYLSNPRLHPFRCPDLGAGKPRHRWLINTSTHELHYYFGSAPTNIQYPISHSSRKYHINIHRWLRLRDGHWFTIFP